MEYEKVVRHDTQASPAGEIRMGQVVSEVSRQTQGMAIVATVNCLQRFTGYIRVMEVCFAYL